MRVNVVCREPKEDSVLGRLARTLAASTGWALSTRPDKTADINYFIIYIDLAERFPNWCATPTAAYFSHYETQTPAKVRWWKQAEELCDLAIVTAEQYKRLRVPRRMARPPVDRNLFTPGPGRVPGRVGVSGIVDKSGRKGPDLVSRLAVDRDVVATGRGWPVETRWRDWERLPDFYRSLSVFLCTSTIEGIPMPPLEALSCGVPIAIPIGVGLLDELPAMPGIYRYLPGDYDSMQSVLDRALTTEHDPEALRALTEPYTAGNWALDHARAFESLLWPSTEVENLPDWRGNSGMYCVAFGKPSRRCAVTCIQSFKRHNPGVPVAFAGVEPLGAGEDLFIQREDLDIGGRQAKLAVYEAAPAEWRYILYLDADVEVRGDLSPLFRILADGWEALICRDMDKYHVARMMRRPDNEAEYNATLDQLGTGDVMQYNGGVFGFRRGANTQRFFELWNREWQKYGARDQGALLRALYHNPLRMFVLGNQWNASDRYPLPAGEIAVLHHNLQARRWEGLIQGRIDSPGAWQAVRAWEAKHR